MTLGARERWFVLVSLLTLTLSAAAWVREGIKAEGTELVDSPSRPERLAAVPSGRPKQIPQRVRLEKMRVPVDAGEGKDAFASRSWRKTPVKTAAPAVSIPVVSAPSLPPPPPQVPPLPFTYMGKIFSDETQMIFLTAGERNLSVREGDVIDATYRLEKVSDAGLIFMYIPAGIQQTLPVGGRQ